MRKELLRRRGELGKLINDINKTERTCNKVQSFKLNKIKKQNIEKYQFINNLLKVIQ